MAAIAKLEAAHRRMCQVKGGQLTIGGVTVDAFPSAATLGSTITEGGQTVEVAVTLTALRSAFARRPVRGASATFTQNGTSRSLKLDTTTESDAFYTFNLIDQRAQ